MKENTSQEQDKQSRASAISQEESIEGASFQPPQFKVYANKPTEDNSAIQAKAPAGKSLHSPSKPTVDSNGEVSQFALPAIIASMGAAEWIAAGALGYSVANDVRAATSGDVTYSFAEMEGSLVPVEENDVGKYNEENRDREVFSGTHHLAVWYGGPDSRKLGMKASFRFLYDDHALGSISMGLMDVYDWPSWGGNIDFNITPLGLAARDKSSIRLTVNMTGERTFAGTCHGNAVFLLDGEGDLSLVSSYTNSDEENDEGGMDRYFHYEIG